MPPRRPNRHPYTHSAIPRSLLLQLSAVACLCFSSTALPTPPRLPQGAAMVYGVLRRLLCCFGSADPRDVQGEQIVKFEDLASAWALLDVVDKGKGGGKGAAVPAAISKQYQKVVPNSVEISGQGVCVTSDLAVLGDVAISAGGTCITGNVLVFGDVKIDGKDGTTVNGTCVTGSIIVLGSAHVRGDVTVEGSVFVKGDVIVEGKLHVGGKLCYWGQQDVRPLAPH
ncbi:MAG: hypothetical protein J3K34DRAFT_34491 [Monoraphidium minutum]|nr:MAG: hypothetical protein J3K34DRAFT_34491 [Monoraphidium minutum]